MDLYNKTGPWTSVWTMYDEWTKAKSGAFKGNEKVLKLVKVYWTLLNMLQNRLSEIVT